MGKIANFTISTYASILSFTCTIDRLFFFTGITLHWAWCAQHVAKIRTTSANAQTSNSAKGILNFGTISGNKIKMVIYPPIKTVARRKKTDGPHVTEIDISIFARGASSLSLQNLIFLLRRPIFLSMKLGGKRNGYFDTSIFDNQYAVICKPIVINFKVP